MLVNSSPSLLPNGSYALLLLLALKHLRPGRRRVYVIRSPDTLPLLKMWTPNFLTHATVSKYILTDDISRFIYTYLETAMLQLSHDMFVVDKR